MDPASAEETLTASTPAVQVSVHVAVILLVITDLGWHIERHTDPPLAAATRS